MLRPLLLNESVALVFEEPDGLPALHTDEGKVSQILRNFISNALKFTERGEVRVSRAPGRRTTRSRSRWPTPASASRREDQERIFQEFTQVDSPLQRRVKGTGLGLPLSRQLAELLGGAVSVESAPGVGSTFTATIPRDYAGRGPSPPEATEAVSPIEPGRVPVLVVEDRPRTC